MNKKVFWLDPYRPFFLISFLLIAINISLWGIHLSGWHLFSITVRDHIHLIISSITGIITGFILTAYPQNLNLPSLTEKTVKKIFLLFATTQFFLISTYYFFPKYTIFAKCFELVFSFSLSLIVIKLFLKSKPSPLRSQERSVVIAVVIGFFVMLGDIDYIKLDYQIWKFIAIFGFLFFLCCTIIYRVLPFFLSKKVDGYCIKRGKWFLHQILLLLVLLLTAKIFQSALAENLLYLLIGGVLLYELIRWKIWRGLYVPFIFFHSISVGWFIFYFFAQPISYWFQLTFNPLHLFLIGGLIQLICSIATRVSLGHANKPLTTNLLDWFLVLLIHIALIFRVFSSYYSVSALFLALALLGTLIRIIPNLFIKIEKRG